MCVCKRERDNEKERESEEEREREKEKERKRERDIDEERERERELVGGKSCVWPNASPGPQTVNRSFCVTRTDSIKTSLLS